MRAYREGRELVCPLCKTKVLESETCEVKLASGHIITICLYCNKLRSVEE